MYALGLYPVLPLRQLKVYRFFGLPPFEKNTSVDGVFILAVSLGECSYDLIFLLVVF